MMLFIRACGSLLRDIGVAALVAGLLMLLVFAFQKFFMIAAFIFVVLRMCDIQEKDEIKAHRKRHHKEP